MSQIDFSVRVGIRSSLILFVWHQGFSFHVYVQFDVAHNQSAITSNVDIVDDDCYVCDDVWPVLGM